ncbi:MAG TPA: hypothetical protein VN767_14010 [Streptosporangiaceae bacterium]|jgi:hypothetical protein|nr:hypothetical protein [Streptosporangiaceae bacterium]
MRKQLARTFLVAGTAIAAMGLAVPAALAAGTWTVTGGPSFTSSGTGTFTLTDTTHSATFTCHVGAAAGTVTDQTSGPSPFGSVTSSSFGNSSNKCSGPLGSTGTSNQKAGTTAHINGTSFAGGVTTGTITGVDHKFTASAFGINCTAEITGTAGVTYNNGTHVLTFTTAGDNLTVISASGCLGIIQVNDKVTFTGSETVTGSPTNPIQISSP